MRHLRKGRKFGRVRKVRKAFLRNLEVHLVLKGKIKTTLARAKELRPRVEKHVTFAKNNSLAHRRQLIRKLPPKAVERLMSEIAPRFQNRAGGYTRIIRMPARKSDGAKMAVIEFV